jgi:hypothetical protein
MQKADVRLAVKHCHTSAFVLIGNDSSRSMAPVYDAHAQIGN